LNLPNLITGKREAVIIPDIRAVLRLLKRDVEAGRAVLGSLLEDVTLHPVGEDVEVTNKGTLGNVLSGRLMADGVIPSWNQTRRTPDHTREMVPCGNRGAGRPALRLIPKLRWVLRVAPI
jgi:hypothetical protein